MRIAAQLTLLTYDTCNDVCTRNAFQLMTKTEQEATEQQEATERPAIRQSDSLLSQQTENGS